MRFFSTLCGGVAASFFVLLLSGCGGGGTSTPPPPPGPVQVTVTASGSGTGAVTSTPAGIDCGATCAHTFSAGTQVTLTATPAAGFSFGGWSGACTGTNACTLATSGTVSVTASFTATLQSINHIIFMAQENRGFDHYFGHLNDYRTAPPYNLPPDVDGTPANASNPSADGTTIVTPILMQSVCVENQSPSWNESHTQYNRQDPLSGIATMDGFVYISAKDAAGNGGFDLEGTRAMGYYDSAALPYYYFMATNFATSDKWFAPVLSRTHPNRMYLMAATSAGHVYPLAKGSPALTTKTIFELLQDNGISWKVYVTDPNPNPIDGTLFNMFAFSRQSQSLPNIVPATQFLTDAANGTLPQVAMIDAGYTSGRDEHPAETTPSGSVEKGSAYVATLINGLMQSPSWGDSVFILTWDEGGGFYDHVPPVTTVSPDGILPIDLNPGDLCDLNTGPTCDFVYTGFRVPMILVSPYANKNSVSHVARDHTSILKLIETRFNLGNLTLRDAAQPDMDEFFDFVNAPWRTPPSPPTQQTTGACYINQVP
jgi:phospholipase C